jgi:glutathione S-transferase
MKLYFAPGACSLAPHIALLEAGTPFELEQVDLRSKQVKNGGGDYRAINPKGSAPALELDDGEVLTEGAMIMQYIADKNPGAKLAPANGTMERYRLQEWLNWIATELHKGISPLFNPKASPEWREIVTANVSARLDFLEKTLERRNYLLGDTYSVADGYLFTILRWTKIHSIDLGKWPDIRAFIDRIAARPATQAALKAEGIS